jgi:predicted GIY-YIG superfamily endonuclease
MNAKQQMIYIGETDDFKRRMDEHRADRSHCMHRYAPALVQAEVVTGEADARRKRESALIAEYAPPCNG